MASAPLRLALAAAMALLALPAVAQAALPKRGIVGGQATTIDQVPWQVALVDTSHYGGAAQFCGGSILDATHVLTAAHCVSEPDSWSADVVYAGTTQLSDPQQVAAVAQQRVYPGYGASGLAGDVAVLTLATPLDLDGTSARAVELASSSTASGAAVVVSGWGDASNGQGFYPNQLRAVTVHAIADAPCAASYGPSLAADVMLCAGEPSGGKDSCSGDSGGPLVDEGTNVLVGVVSFGYQCALAGYPGVYVEVAAPAIRAFVASALGEDGDTQPITDPPPASPPASQPIAAAPAAPADTEAPRATIQASSCTRTACTLLIRVSDAGVSAGIRGVEGSVRSRWEASCRLHGHRTPCTRTTSGRTLQATPAGPASFRLRAAGLPAGAAHRFALVAVDNAGHRQADATVVRLATRPTARQLALRRGHSKRHKTNKRH